MGDFWDERAREDAFFFVDDRLEYRNPDEQRFWDQGREALEIIFATLGVAPGAGDVVLDVGCGLGRLTRELASRARAVVALDVSAEMLERARSLNAGLDNVRWVQGDGTTLAGIDDASVDAVVSHVVFQHLPDPEITYGYVREMGRVLRPGGWAAFQVSNDPAVHAARATGVLDRARSTLGRAPKGRDAAAWLGSAVDLDRLRDTADAGGMAVEHVENEGTQYCLVLARRGAG
jgi:SAM-dependent methyltransferase